MNFFLIHILRFCIILCAKRKNCQNKLSHKKFQKKIFSTFFNSLKFYFLGVMEIFIIVLNNNVHILMYTYYFLSSFKKLLQPLKKFKRLMTAIQIFQLVLILGQCVAAKMCGYPNLFYVTGFNVLVLIFFFGNFYYKTYLNKKTKNE